MTLCIGSRTQLFQPVANRPEGICAICHAIFGLHHIGPHNKLVLVPHEVVAIETVQVAEGKGL